MSITSKFTATQSERLIIFTRYPEPGNTKTRLIPALGPDGAAELQRQMTQHALSQARQVKRPHPLSIEIHHTGGSQQLMQQWLGQDIDYHPQGSGNLGERMEQAFREAFNAGVNRTVIIGTDCPELGFNHVQKAFAALENSDLVLGPAQDGGYYLIGLKTAIPKLFAEISWGTNKVREHTIRIAEELGLKTHLLELLHDIDHPEDLPVWQNCAKKLDSDISIIIPTLNEETNIAQTLGCIPINSDIEVIVADGSSNDETVELARSGGAKVLSHVPGGRANQLNSAALLAKGETLLFLHADTLLPQGFAKQIQQIITKPGVAGGAFRLSIDGSSFGLRLVEKITNWRSQVLEMPYGDQAIFVKNRLFHKLGGFPNIPIMEDFELIRHLQKQGEITIAPLSVITSARRWQKLGVWRTTLINQTMILAYYLGVNPAHLARWYRGNITCLRIFNE